MKTTEIKSSENTIKRRIWEKLRWRMSRLGLESDCPEMNPDVIVISRNETTVFEPQNRRAANWLGRRCYSTSELTIENTGGHTEIQVHPQLREKFIAELKAAGFTVNS